MNKICCALYVCYLYIAGVDGAITQQPSNAATNVGGQPVFNCSADVTDTIDWIYSTDCNPVAGLPLTVNNCDIDSKYASNYKTEKPDGFACNLIIFNASLSLGGCYTCGVGFGAGNAFHGMLTIIDSSANVTTNTTEWVSGEDVQISSSVTYRGPSISQVQPSPLPPSFFWTLQSDHSQNITSYPEVPTNTSASSYIIVRAQPPEIPRYESHLFFNPPVYVPPDCASNAPIYMDVTVTLPYPVSYPPENISISGYPTGCPYDDNKDTPLKCSASGYPSPIYAWVDLTKPDKSLSKSDTLTIREDGIYQCTASNVIRGEVNSISTVANISDCFPYLEPIPPPSNCDPLCIAILVIAIYFGLNLLFFIIFITPYGCSKNGRNKMNDRFPWLKDMLPCLNGEGCKCSVWIFYFVILSIFVGFVFFPTIMIMASCCKENKKGSQGNTHQNERGKNGRGAANIQMTTSGTTPNQSPSRLSVTTNPPSSLPTTAHYPQDRPSRPYPHSSNQQLQPTYSEYSDPYPRSLRQTPSPALSAGGVVYAELGVDNKPMSRRPIQPIQGDGDAYAAIALA